VRRRADSRSAVPDTVVSAGVLPASPAQVWNALRFYEQLAERPSWLLRALLPTPLRTDLRPWEAGVETRCLYEDGFVVKRLTHVEPPSRCEFEVVLQRLEIGRGIRLAGGLYGLSETPGRGTRLELQTRFESAARPREFWRPIEAAVCRIFHRHILASLRRELEREVKASAPPDAFLRADPGTPPIRLTSQGGDPRSHRSRPRGASPASSPPRPDSARGRAWLGRIGIGGPL